MTKRLFASTSLFALALALPAPWHYASAQNAITQEGTTVKDAPVMLKGNNRARQGATVNGAPSGQIVTTGDAVVGGRCDYSAPTDDPNGYYRICLDAKTGTIRLDGTKLPAQGTLKIDVGGTVYDMPLSAAVVGSDAVVANTAALKLATGATGKRLARLGSTTIGDGGLAPYNWSGTNCPKPDNGAEVQPTGVVGCWKGDFSGIRLTPEIWDAKGDGIADDAVAVNAASDYVALKGGTLYGRPGAKYGVRATVKLAPDVCLVGEGMDKSGIVLLDGAVSPIVDVGSRGCLDNIHVDATLQTNSGTIIQLGKSSDDVRGMLRRVTTEKGCIAVDLNGVSQSIDQSYFYNMAATAGCGGIRVGHNTTGATTVEPRITNTTVQCDFTKPDAADYDIRLEDSGGAFLGSGVDAIGCRNGTIIKPGANQEVSATTCSAAYIGDTNKYEGMLIDTGDPTALVRGNSFENCWTSGSIGRSGTKIQNTGGGTITGTMLLGHRAYLNFFNGVEIAKPVAGTITDTQVVAARICGTQTGTDFLIGDNLSVTLQNSRLGKQCDGYTAGNTVGLLYGLGIGANVTLIATGNDLSYTGPETWAPVSGVPVGDSVVDNNKGTDTIAGPTYASAGTVTLTQTAPRIHLTGTVQVNTITPAWNGQPLCIISDSGIIAFGTTGNIAAPVSTSGAGSMVCGYYDKFYTKWYLH